MSSESEEFKVGDSVLIVGTNHDGELGTIIAIAAGPDGQRYLIVFENGNRSAFNAENLSYRRCAFGDGQLAGTITPRNAVGTSQSQEA